MLRSECRKQAKIVILNGAQRSEESLWAEKLEFLRFAQNDKVYVYEIKLGQSHYDSQDIVDNSLCQLYVEDK